jgi:broad specificity phosphatase PhoE
MPRLGVAMSARLVLIAAVPTATERRGAWPCFDDAAEPIAPLTAAWLREAAHGASEVRCAPERAAGDTAVAIGATAHVEPELAAWSLGSWAGRRPEDVAAEEPAAVDAWRHDPSSAPPGGESLRCLLRRTATWLDVLAVERWRVVAVASAPVVRALAVAALDADPAVFWRLDVSAPSVSVLTRHDGAWRVRTIGAAPP